MRRRNKTSPYIFIYFDLLWNVSISGCRMPLLTYLLTYLLTPWSRVLLEKLTGSQLLKKFPAFYGTRTFITAFTSTRHLSLSWASSIQSISPHPTSWRSILIFFHLRLGLPNGLFPSGFPTKTLYTHLLSHIRATCPAHLILLDFILCEEYRSLSSSLWLQKYFEYLMLLFFSQQQLLQYIASYLCYTYIACLGQL